MLVPFAIARSSAAHFATGCYVITLPRTFRVESMISALWIPGFCVILHHILLWLRFLYDSPLILSVGRICSLMFFRSIADTHFFAS